MENRKPGKTSKVKNMRVKVKTYTRKGADPLISDIPVDEFFKPITLFANAEIDPRRPEEVRRLLYKCWSPYREAVFNFPDWIYHEEALKPKKRISLKDWFRTTNYSMMDKMSKGRVKQGAALKQLKTKEIKTLVEFQLKFKNKLNSMFKPKVKGMDVKTWAEGVGSSFFWASPVTADIKYLQYAKTGYPQHGVPSFWWVFSDFQNYLKYLLAQLINQGLILRLKRCHQCEKYYFAKTGKESKYCEDKCRFNAHNKMKIESGYSKKYMKRKRAEGNYKYY